MDIAVLQRIGFVEEEAGEESEELQQDAAETFCRLRKRWRVRISFINHDIIRNLTVLTGQLATRIPCYLYQVEMPIADL